MAFAGFNCRLMVGGTEITLARDVEYSIDGDTINSTDRSATAFRSFIAGLAEASCTVSTITDKSNTVFQALRTAILARSTVEVRVLDGDNHGWSSSCYVNSMREGQPLEDVGTTDWTLKPNGAPTVLTDNS